MVIAVIAVLVSLMLPALAGARESGRRVACTSNVRQLALANDLYALDHAERYAPAAAEARQNLHRWHGTRGDVREPFSPDGGALTGYIDATAPESGASVRTCPTFLPRLRELVERGLAGAGFERSAGGYGYNKAFVGSVRAAAAGTPAGPARMWLLADDRLGSPRHRFASPGATIAFADAALAAETGGAVIEYSFAEPRFWPDAPGYRADPSVHFRHDRGRQAAGAATVAWLDGHVSGDTRTFTWASGVYPGDPAAAGVGWMGSRDDNGLYDYE